MDGIPDGFGFEGFGPEGLDAGGFEGFSAEGLDAGGFEPYSFEPDFMEPNSFEPMTIEPDLLEPEFLEPMSLQPEMLEPEAFEPTPLQPEMFEPDVFEPMPLQPELLEPEVFEPIPFQPELLEPEAFEPIPLQPELFEPETFEPMPLQPDLLEPEAFEPIPLQPELFEPETFEPMPLQPELLAPETFEPIALQPEMLEPTLFQSEPLEPETIIVDSLDGLPGNVEPEEIEQIYVDIWPPDEDSLLIPQADNLETPSQTETTEPDTLLAEAQITNPENTQTTDAVQPDVESPQPTPTVTDDSSIQSTDPRHEKGDLLEKNFEQYVRENEQTDFVWRHGTVTTPGMDVIYFDNNTGQLVVTEEKNWGDEGKERWVSEISAWEPERFEKNMNNFLAEVENDTNISQETKDKIILAANSGEVRREIVLGPHTHMSEAKMEEYGIDRAIQMDPQSKGGFLVLPK